MSLRRPPTRFELKGDDMEEYNKVRVVEDEDKKMRGVLIVVMSDATTTTTMDSLCVGTMLIYLFIVCVDKIMREREMAKADTTKDGDAGTESSSAQFPFASPAAKKAAAAQRIGIGHRPGGAPR